MRRADLAIALGGVLLAAGPRGPDAIAGEFGYTEDSDGNRDGSVVVCRAPRGLVRMEKGSTIPSRSEAPSGGYRFEFRDTSARFHYPRSGGACTPVRIAYRLVYQSAPLAGPLRELIPDAGPDAPEGWQYVTLMPGSTTVVRFTPLVGISGRKSVVSRLEARADGGSARVVWLRLPSRW